MKVKTSKISFATLKMSQSLLAGGKFPQHLINVEVLINRKMGKFLKTSGQSLSQTIIRI